MAKYFNDIGTLEELRKQYKDLLKKHHPDNGGNVADMQEINVEYEKLFKALKDKHESKTGNDGTTNKESYENMRWSEAEDETLRKMLSNIIHIPDITIEIIGNWIWVGGSSYPHRQELKEIGFKFARNKKMWYWHSEAFRKKSHKKLSINDIRNYYGSTNVETDGLELLQA